MELEQVERPERCDKCRFWDREDEDIEMLVEENGLCKRFPPLGRLCKTGMHGPGIPELDKYYFELPETCPHDWCGEFQKRQSIPSWADFIAPLSVRCRNCLNRFDPIESIDGLLEMKSSDLIKRKNFGLGCLSEIIVRLSQFGLKLKGD